jgi:endonuclease/exonuclease/phosphatase family metal-dependent hydrolase
MEVTLQPAARPARKQAGQPYTAANKDGKMRIETWNLEHDSKDRKGRIDHQIQRIKKLNPMPDIFVLTETRRAVDLSEEGYTGIFTEGIKPTEYAGTIGTTLRFGLNFRSSGKKDYPRNNIDHICVTKGAFKITNVGAWDHFEESGIILSDHNGVYVDLAQQTTAGEQTTITNAEGLA